jgi:hypothetical protein
MLCATSVPRRKRFSRAVEMFLIDEKLMLILLQEFIIGVARKKLENSLNNQKSLKTDSQVDGHPMY